MKKPTHVHVRAKAGLVLPQEGRGRATYPTDRDIKVLNSSYVRRRIAAGELIVAKSRSTKSTKKSE